MSVFETTAPKFRLAETRFADTLPAIALRELGDANRWVELVWLNDLKPPYLVDDPRLLADRVIQTGGLIKVPAPTGLWTDSLTSAADLYLTDARLQRKLLGVNADGDIDVVSGIDNLDQQLSHRLVTPLGQAQRHPDYGCQVWRLIGRVNGAVAGALGAEYVKATLAQDARVAKVKSAESSIEKDSIRIKAKIEAVDGSTVDLMQTQNY